jgi:hypothetical protein
MTTNEALPKKDESVKDQAAPAELEHKGEELKPEETEKIAGGHSGHGHLNP